MITSARQSRNLVHHLLYDCGNRLVISVGGFSVLEVSIAVLGRTFLNGVIGVKRATSEIFYIFHIHEFFHILVVDSLYFGNLVARSETVEEMKEGYFGFKRGKVRYQSEIHNLLYGVGRKHRKARLTARHNVRMVAENVKRMCGKRSCADVEHAGKKFAGYLVHIRNHKEQTLRSGVSNGKRARGKRTVHRTCCACLRLHFGKAKFLTEHVGSACGSPLVRNFRHRRGRGYRVNRRHFRKSVSNVARGGITVDSHNFHLKTTSVKKYSVFILFL